MDHSLSTSKVWKSISELLVPNLAILLQGTALTENQAKDLDPKKRKRSEYTR